MEPENYGLALNLDHLKNMEVIKETSRATLWLIKGAIWCKIPSLIRMGSKQETEQGSNIIMNNNDNQDHKYCSTNFTPPKRKEV